MSCVEQTCDLRPQCESCVSITTVGSLSDIASSRTNFFSTPQVRPFSRNYRPVEVSWRRLSSDRRVASKAAVRLLSRGSSTDVRWRTVLVLASPTGTSCWSYLREAPLTQVITSVSPPTTWGGRLEASTCTSHSVKVRPNTCDQLSLAGGSL